jgi:multidrug efflux pump subunit AcrB
MGLIMVIGIVAKNGILLLDAESRFKREGLSPKPPCCKPGAAASAPSS